MTTEHGTPDDGPAARAGIDWGLLGVGVAVGWVVLEVALRWGVVSLLGPVLGSPLAADWATMLLGFPLVAGVLLWIATRRGRPPAGWGYDWSRRSLAAGVGGIVVALVAVALAAQVDAYLFALEAVGEAFGAAIGDALRAAPALLVVFLVGNGLVVPIAEEAVWRGVVQSELVEAWGGPAGIALTAALFALKHAVVDLSVGRLTTLFALGLVLGLVRHRYGTASSTVTHAGVNTLSSAAVVATALA